MSNIAYLTCELKSRDLDLRLLLAAHLVKRGFSVIVGQQWGMFANAASAPVGVVLFKSANKIQAREMARFKAAGHAVVTADEEMLASIDRDQILRRTDAAAIENSDLFLFQSDRHEKVLREAYPRIRGITTGNLRVDLLSRFRAIYDQDSAALKAAGKYILVNTNFTITNSIWGSVNAAITAAEKSGVVKTTRDMTVMLEQVDTEQLNREHLVALVQWMKTELADYRIVVRPHPAENPAAWRAVDGVEVIVGSNPIPWISGADLVVHSNCTTGLEAILLGRPCINVSTVADGRPATQFVAKVNYTVTTSDEAGHAIKAFVATGRGPIAEFTLPPDLYPAGAAERVADVVFETATTLPTSPQKATWHPYKRKEVHRTKFTVSKNEVQSRMALIGKIMGLENIVISEIEDSLFLMRLAS